MRKSRRGAALKLSGLPSNGNIEVHITIVLKVVLGGKPLVSEHHTLSYALYFIIAVSGQSLGLTENSANMRSAW